MKRNILLNNTSIDSSNINNVSLSPNYKRYTRNIISYNSPRAITINQLKKAKEKEKFNIKIVNDIKNKKMLKKNKNTNSNLKPQNYVKPLNFALNKRFKFVNTQFKNYNDKTSIIKNTNDNISKIIYENNTYKYYMNNNSKNSPKTKVIHKNENKKNKSNNKVKKKLTLNISKLMENEGNNKIIQIQSNYRGHFMRNKLYNTLLLYLKVIKIVNNLKNKCICDKNGFLKNLFLTHKHIIEHVKSKNDKITSDDMNSIDNSYATNISTYRALRANMKNKKPNYIISNVNNIQINSNINNNNEQKKKYEEKIKELMNKNRIIKEENRKYHNKEDIYNNIKAEYDKLININNNTKKYNEQLLIELNSLKEKYNKLLNEKKNTSYTSFHISKQSEINMINHDLNENVGISVNNDNNVNNNNNNKGFKNDRKEREKYLRNLFKNKVFEMKEHIHKYFTRFYYNGVFLQMTGKLKHVDNEVKTNEKENNNNTTNNVENNINSAGDNNNITNNIENNNNSTNNNEDETKKNETYNKISKKNSNELDEFRERLKKSRGLRRLMNKKAKERLEILRKYFYKFYQAGIFSQIRKTRKRKSCIFQPGFSLELTREKFGLRSSLSSDKTRQLSSKAYKEKEELKTKTCKVLEKIIFKTDRKNMIILKNAFHKYQLKAKLDALQNIIDTDKSKNNKKKKKKKKKIKKKEDSIPDSDQNQVQNYGIENGDDIGENNNNNKNDNIEEKRIKF